MRRLGTLLSALLMLSFALVPEAFAGPRGITRDGGGVTALDSLRKVKGVKSEDQPKRVRSVAKDDDARTSGRNKAIASRLSPEALTRLHNQRARKQQAQIESAIQAYAGRVNAFNACQQSSAPQNCSFPSDPDLDIQTATATLSPGQNRGNRVADPAVPPPVVLTPQQVAYMAFARLKLSAPTPRVGPPPSINEWNMAAVGYPLWLWAEGETDPTPVSDAVGGLSVALEAKVSKIVFDMGDGTKVTCEGTGRKWTRSVPPGQKSPECGHVYSKPSLPDGKYEITATTHWAVAWTVTGQRGVIPFVQSASTTLPVGELQVLVR